MSNISVRLNPATEKYLSGEKNKSAAVNRVVEAWATCEKQARISLKGKFSAGQLCAFIDALNGTMLDIAQANYLQYEFEDACKLEGLGEKWKIDKDKTLAILRGLSPAEVIILVEFCRAFWDDPDANIREYVKIFAKK
jgi:hypothetical protein